MTINEKKPASADVKTRKLRILVAPSNEGGCA